MIDISTKCKYNNTLTKIKEETHHWVKNFVFVKIWKIYKIIKYFDMVMKVLKEYEKNYEFI